MEQGRMNDEGIMYFCFGTFKSSLLGLVPIEAAKQNMRLEPFRLMYAILEYNYRPWKSSEKEPHHVHGGQSQSKHASTPPNLSK